jgi:hypothetical protein
MKPDRSETGAATQNLALENRALQDVLLQERIKFDEPSGANGRYGQE